MMENTDEHQQCTEVTSSQIFMENSNIIDLSRVPKSSTKQTESDKNKNKKENNSVKRSYLIREIHSSYDQYYDTIRDRGQKSKQIDSLLGVRQSKDTYTKQPFSRTLRSSRVTRQTPQQIEAKYKNMQKQTNFQLSNIKSRGVY